MTTTTAIDGRKLVSKLSEYVSPFDDGRTPEGKRGLDWPAFPEPETFWAAEPVAELHNELLDCDSNVPDFVTIVCSERLASIQLLAVAAIRQGAHEILGATIKLLNYSRLRNEADNIGMRWAAAITIGLMGPVAKEALPALRRRLKRETHRDARAALEWAIGEIKIGGSK